MASRPDKAEPGRGNKGPQPEVAVSASLATGPPPQSSDPEKKRRGKLSVLLNALGMSEHLLCAIRPLGCELPSLLIKGFFFIVWLVVSLLVLDLGDFIFGVLSRGHDFIFEFEKLALRGMLSASTVLAVARLAALDLKELQAIWRSGLGESAGPVKQPHPPTVANATVRELAGNLSEPGRARNIPTQGELAGTTRASSERARERDEQMLRLTEMLLRVADTTQQEREDARRRSQEMERRFTETVRRLSAELANMSRKHDQDAARLVDALVRLGNTLGLVRDGPVADAEGRLKVAEQLIEHITRRVDDLAAFVESSPREGTRFFRRYSPASDLPSKDNLISFTRRIG